MVKEGAVSGLCFNREGFVQEHQGEAADGKRESDQALPQRRQVVESRLEYSKYWRVVV